MSALTLLEQLRTRGISLATKDGRLLSKPPIPKELLPAIKEHKLDLIELLESDDQAAVSEDDFMTFFQQAIHEISAYWHERSMPQPSTELARHLDAAEDRLNLAPAQRMPKADFKGLVDRYIHLHTHALAYSNQGGEKSGQE